MQASKPFEYGRRVLLYIKYLPLLIYFDADQAF